MDDPASSMSDTATIHLEHFSRRNADLVLAWRNAEHVRANSIDDRRIERADHLRFLGEIAGGCDRNYVLVHLRGTPIGALSIDRREEFGYWGCYLGGDPSTVRPGLFSLLIGVAGWAAFEGLGCGELRSEVLEHNRPPQRMNAFLGIPIAGRRRVERPSGETINVISYVLSRETWPSVLERLEQTLTPAMRNALAAFGRAPHISRA